MATNFDFEYANAMKKYEDAKTLPEKIAALELMKSTAPSHKGAEKLRIDISRKLAKMKEKLEIESQKKTGSKTMSVKKEGSVQVVLAGLPNSGKSTLLKAITNATPLIAPYEFTTVEPEIGVMDYKGAKIQVVEVPAIIKESYIGRARGKEKISIIRNADYVLFPFVGSIEDIKSQYDLLSDELTRSGIFINKKRPGITVKKSGMSKGIEVIGEQYLKMEYQTLSEVLRSRGIFAAIVILEEDCDLNKLEEAIDNSLAYKGAIGLWLDGQMDFKYAGIDIYSVSLNDLAFLKETIYKHLDLIMIYTRKPGERDSDKVPVVLKKGSTIFDLCSNLHNDFIDKFNYAKVWGSSKFPGQTVSKDFELKEGDIVEVFAKK